MPTRKDKTNVAPIYREQVFIPASGATLIKQKARPKFNGFPIASGAIEIVSPEFDLLTGVRGIANLPKGFLKTNKLPQGENLYYRQLDKSSKGLERAKQVGVIDTKSAPPKTITFSSGKTIKLGKTFNTPFFSKGHLWYNNVDDMDVIVGKDNPLLDWKTITKGGGVTTPTPLNSRRTPFYMGESNQAPTELFELYRRYPGIGYRNVTYGFPTIPITGLNTIAEQMKCGGRRKAQLGLDIREGGIAIPINKNMYYMQGRSHDEGGIGIGPNNKNGLEVEGGEVVKVDNDSIKVFSSVPLLRGVSPAQLVMGGANPNKVFKAQEDFKDRNNINDDGTTYQIGGEKNNKYPLRALTENESRPLGGYPTISGVRTYKYLRGLVKGTKAINKGTNLFRAGRYKLKETVNSAIKSGKLNPQLGQAIKSTYNKFIGSTGQELPKTINLIFGDNKTEKKAGGIYIKPSKRGTFTAAAKKRGMSVQKFASKVLANKENYSPAMVKKANFARNASRWKKELGGNMIYEINGNVKNGLMSLRPKAELGKEKKINSTTKIGADGLIYTWGPYGKWYTDGTRYEDSKYYMREKSVLSEGRRSDGSVVRPKQKTQSLDEFVITATRPKKKEETAVSNNVSNDNTTNIKNKSGNSRFYVYDEQGNRFYRRSDGTLIRTQNLNLDKNASILDEVVITAPRINEQEVVEPVIQTTSNTLPQYYAEKRMPMFGEQSVAEKMGIARSGWSYGSAPTISGVNENVLAWDYPAINYRKLNRKQREEISKIPNSQAVKQEVPTNEKPYTANVPSMYDIATQVYGKYIAPKVADGTINLNAAPEETKTSKTKTSENKDERLIGQYKKLTAEDWIGLGSNVIGSLANYFINKNTINKMPMPTRPVSTPAAKLKTHFNINAPLSELREAEQLQRNIISRNTQSSNVSRAAQQRAINEAQRGRNQLYTQKENVETQLINQDRLNRQSIAARNIAAYNDWMNRLTSAKINQSQLRSANVTNLISGLTGGVTDILGRIENRRATNNALRAYAAANPNVDARIIGGFDYYRDAQGRKYDKNGRLIG